MDISEDGQENRDFDSEVPVGSVEDREDREPNSEPKETVDNTEHDHVGPKWGHGKDLSNKNLLSSLNSLKDILSLSLDKEKEKLETYTKMRNNFGKK